MKNIATFIFLLCCITAFSQGGIKGEWLAIIDDVIFDFSDGDSLAIVQFDKRDDTSKWRYFPIQIKENQIEILHKGKILDGWEIIGHEEGLLRIYDASWEKEFYLVQRPAFNEDEIAHFFYEGDGIEVSYPDPLLGTVIKESFYPADFVNGKTHNYCRSDYSCKWERRESGLFLFFNWSPSYSDILKDEYVLKGKYLIEEIKNNGFYAIPPEGGERVFVKSKHMEEPEPINLDDFAGEYAITSHFYTSLQLDKDGTFALKVGENKVRIKGTWKLYFFDGDTTLILIEQKGSKIRTIGNYRVSGRTGSSDFSWHLHGGCFSNWESACTAFLGLPSSLYLQKSSSKTD